MQGRSVPFVRDQAPKKNRWFWSRIAEKKTSFSKLTPFVNKISGASKLVYSGIFPLYICITFLGGKDLYAPETAIENTLIWI